MLYFCSGLEWSHIIDRFSEEDVALIDKCPILFWYF